MFRLSKKVSEEKLKNFIKKIQGKQFAENKNLLNAPWKYIKKKKFEFFFILINNKIIGSLVILNTYYSSHLSFLYIINKYRNNKIGSYLIKKFENYKKKKLKTIHVTKSLNNAMKFYENKGYTKYINQKDEKLLRWISRCNAFDKTTFNKRFLYYKYIKS
tara:strand:+ start:80 stop:559 length:480 start_codon:yes stop_codon:yes gene_type:complete